MMRLLNQLYKRLPSAVQQSAVYALALAGAKGISLLMVPVFTHYLAPEDYGRLDILQTLADILSIVIGLGLADTLFRFCNEEDIVKSREVASRLFGLAWLIAIFSFVILQATAPLIATLLPGDITVLQTRLILSSLSLSGTILVPLAWLRFRSKAGLYLTGSLGRTVFQAGLAALFLILGFGVTGFVFAGFIACICLSLFVGFLQYRDTGIKFGFDAIKSFGPYGGPLIFTGIAGFIIGSFDRWILADAVGTASMAQYALAAKFGLITAVLIQPFDMWWHAKRFTVLAQENGARQCARVANIAFLIVCAAVLIVCAISPALITWLTPNTYHQSISYVPYLVVFAALHNLTQTLGFGIYTEKTTRLPALIDGTSAGIALIGYFTLISAYGIIGAVAATFIALAIRITTTVICAQKTCWLPYEPAKWLILTAYTLGAVVAFSYLPDHYLLLLVGACSLLGLAVLGGVLKIIKLSVMSHDAPEPAE